MHFSENNQPGEPLMTKEYVVLTSVSQPFSGHKNLMKQWIGLKSDLNMILFHFNEILAWYNCFNDVFKRKTQNQMCCVNLFKAYWFRPIVSN